MEILISGASTGIGKSSAVHMARLGHSVWAGVRSERDFDAIKKINVKGLKPIYLDVTKADSIDTCMREITKSAGLLHGLINNAGIAVGGPLEALSLEDWRRQFEINVFGAVALTKAFLPLLRQSKGRIVNMSSLSGKVAFPFMSPYAASKFALEGMSDSLRRELAPLGVSVIVIEPGSIATPIWEKATTEGLGKVASYSAEIRAVYGRLLEVFSQKLDETAKSAAPVSVVTSAIEHALTATTPRTRYPVGKGVKVSMSLMRLVPDRWVDRLMK
jgi:NAD(P)-dependent dehydrogenase (short-subunit alcohol dehydrogenase family)